MDLRCTRVWAHRRTLQHVSHTTTRPPWPGSPARLSSPGTIIVSVTRHHVILSARTILFLSPLLRRAPGLSRIVSISFFSLWPFSRSLSLSLVSSRSGLSGISKSRPHLQNLHSTFYDSSGFAPQDAFPIPSSNQTFHFAFRRQQTTPARNTSPRPLAPSLQRRTPSPLSFSCICISHPPSL